MKQIKILLWLLFAVFFTACGGGSSTTDNNNASEESMLQEGIFLSSHLSGINYKTQTTHGQTSIDGKFSYSDGESVLFSIGDIDIGTATAATVITPLELIQDEASESEVNAYLINVLRFLLTIDENHDYSDGIAINSYAHAEAEGITLSFNQSVEQFELDMSVHSYLTLLGIDELVDKSDAEMYWSSLISNELYGHILDDDPSKPLILVAYDGSTLALLHDEFGKDEGAILRTSEGDEVTILYQPDGLPTSLFVSGTYFHFLYSDDGLVNVGVITDDGNISTFTNLPNPFSAASTVNKDTADLSRQLYPANTSSFKSPESQANAYKNAEKTVSTILFANMITNHIKGNGLKFNPKSLKETLTTAVIKETVLQEVSSTFGVDINSLRTVGVITDIAINTTFCAKGDVGDCVDLAVTSSQQTAEAVHQIILTLEENKRLEKLIDVIKENKDNVPIVVAGWSIIGAKSDVIGVRYKVHVESTGSEPFVDGANMSFFYTYTNDLSGKKIISPMKSISDPFEIYFGPGTHTIEVTGIDDFTFTKTIKLQINLPELPTVKDDVLNVASDETDVTSVLSGPKSEAYTYHKDASNHASKGTINLDATTGKFTYVYTENSDTNDTDSFKYYIKMKLNDNCIKNGDFQCTIDSNHGKIGINIERKPLCIENPDEYFTGIWTQTWERYDDVDTLISYSKNPYPEPQVPYGSIYASTLQGYPLGRTVMYYDTPLPWGVWDYNCDDKSNGGDYGTLTFTFYHYDNSGGLFNRLSFYYPVDRPDQTSFVTEINDGVIVYLSK